MHAPPDHDLTDILPPVAGGDTGPMPALPAACPLAHHPRLYRAAVIWLRVNIAATLALWTAAVLVAAWVLKGWTLG